MTASRLHRIDAQQPLMIRRVVSQVSKSVRLLLTANQDQCNVAFEPEGAVLGLADKDALTVEISGPGTGLLEIMYGRDSLTVCAWEGATTRVWNKAGAELQV
jgi:hypothetical protein